MKLITIQLNSITSQPSTAMIAVQKPLSRTLILTWISAARMKKVFSAKTSNYAGQDDGAECEP